MASKMFALCALLCAVQGLNGAAVRPSNLLPEESLESDLYNDAMGRFQSMESEYAAIIDDFENVVLNTESKEPDAEFSGVFDDVMESVEDFDGNDMAQAGVDVEVIRQCIREQGPNIRKFVQEMRQKVADARVQFRQLLADTFGPYLKKAREAFRILATEIAEFPMRMWECIQKMDFMGALEVIKNTRKVVTEQGNEIARNIKEARGQLPMIREKAREMKEKLRIEAKAAINIIHDAMKECVANGGPKVRSLPFGSGAIAQEDITDLIAPIGGAFKA